MESYIPISYLNDFLFCPRSIYFHNLYDQYDKKNYHRSYQTLGNIAHQSIDEKTYSTHKNHIIGIEVYSPTYELMGKIDLYDADKKLLVERKRKIKQIYDGYRYQLYAQYFCLTEMGYSVKRMALHSLIDNQRYSIDIPQAEETQKFNQLIKRLKKFNFEQEFKANKNKCDHCVYSGLCDKSLSINQ